MNLTSFRNLWGRPLFLEETPEIPGGATPPAPGTGGASPVDPSAPTPSGATPPVAGGDPPGPVPYARFQEVNTARRELEEAMQPYRGLEESGYGADDLQRLTMWEQEYMQDPVGTWLRQAEQIEGLPESVKAAITAVGESAPGTQGGSPADGSPPIQTPAAPVDDVLEQRLATLETDREARVAREQEEAVRGFYDGLVSAWRQLDEAQGIFTPEEAIHAHLAAASPTASSAEEILRGGRESYLAVREQMLAHEIKPSGIGHTVPRPVPGGGGAGAPPVRPKTLAEARRAAEADPMFQQS